MSKTQTQLPTDVWLPAAWQEYLQTLANRLNDKAKSYSYKEHMRLEMPPVSFDHGQDHVIIIFAVTLFATLKQIPATGFNTATFRKTRIQDCQPDVPCSCEHGEIAGGSFSSLGYAAKYY